MVDNHSQFIIERASLSRLQGFVGEDYLYWKDIMEMYINIDYEGIKDVRLRKAVSMTKLYESFTVKDEESMNDMFGRLKVLLNNLEALGQTYSKAQINRKVLESFPKVWEPKTTTTQEARDLENLAWDELLGIQRVHKVHLQNREHFQKKNFVALNFEETHFRREEKKSLSKALKVQMQETDGSDNSNASTDDEVILMSKKFKQMMKKKRKF
ncbi:hypothetical protein JHK82_024744 [Glycine max]|uniref:Uncharacterized protein n=1 Tax=Glycine max TaxID=3847 RepID=A0A0R0I6Z3_SOYBN|nr:hypothetical protein JHK87_024696 [Glycine soja]KAG5006803.1 hypothetical protein JHK85_025345 [Glycine max]KAG5012600.1 hypothetical protein JHK86_024861 [Glycine max]KAG5133556.1 hypothetical protein JHK82_024744 [Glycine max]